MDKADRNVKNNQIRDESTDEDEMAPTKQAKAVTVRIVDSGYAPDSSGYLAKQKSIIDEDWKELDVYEDDHLCNSYTRYEMAPSSRKIPEICSPEGFLEKISQISVDSNKRAPVVAQNREMIVETLWDDQGSTYKQIKDKFSAIEEEELIMLIAQLCWHVKGLYTLKGAIRHHKEKVAIGKDRVCFAIHNG